MIILSKEQILLLHTQLLQETGGSDGMVNFDGSGFPEKLLNSKRYQRICSRITTYVPQSSIVGMLLEHQGTIHGRNWTNAGRKAS